MREIQVKRIYRHFKGDYYLVEDVAKHSETDEGYVIYRKLYGDCGLWIRPLAMFLEPDDREKYRTLRRHGASSFRKSILSPVTERRGEIPLSMRAEVGRDG